MVALIDRNELRAAIAAGTVTVVDALPTACRPAAIPRTVAQLAGGWKPGTRGQLAATDRRSQRLLEPRVHRHHGSGGPQ